MNEQTLKINEWDKLNHVIDTVVDHQIFCLYNWILHGNSFIIHFWKLKIIIMDAEFYFILFNVFNFELKKMDKYEKVFGGHFKCLNIGAYICQ
jgi:hypothetical protein